MAVVLGVALDMRSAVVVDGVAELAHALKLDVELDSMMITSVSGGGEAWVASVGDLCCCASVLCNFARFAVATAPAVSAF